MIQRWDGVWTEELLRDLTGGLTRTSGQFTVRIGRHNESVRRSRIDGRTMYQIGYTEEEVVINGDGATTDAQRSMCVPAEQAVMELNEREAVPVNDDGTLWKVKRVYEDCGC